MDTEQWIARRKETQRRLHDDLNDALFYAMCHFTKPPVVVDPAMVPAKDTSMDELLAGANKAVQDARNSWMRRQMEAMRTVTTGRTEVLATCAPHSDRAGIVAAAQAKSAEEAIAATVAYCNPPAVKSNVKSALAGMTTTASGDHRPGLWGAQA